MGRYHAVLKKEIHDFSAVYTGSRQINTIFFGGGTPSTYPDDLLIDMFDTLRRSFVFDQSSEISIEVNPGTVRKEQLALWRQIGINRMSVGVQSLKDQVLKSLNRLQSRQQVEELLNSAPEFISNISIDLILGLPDVTIDEWKALIKQVVQWPIKHVSVYFLTVHEDTPLYFKVQTNRITLPTDETMVDLYEWTVNELEMHGLHRYELSNFARPGFESRHNTVYWERKPYKAFGLGACSFDGKNRTQNEKNLMRYMEGIERNQPVEFFHEELGPNQIHLETLMLGLRRRSGVSWSDIMKYASPQGAVRLKKMVDDLEKEKFIVQEDDRIRLTTSGMAVENQIVAKLSEV